MKKLMLLIVALIVVFMSGCATTDLGSGSDSDDLYDCTHQDVLYDGVTLRAGYLNGSSETPMVTIKKNDKIIMLLIRPLDLVCEPVSVRR